MTHKHSTTSYQIRAAFLNVRKVPDPTKISTSHEWWFINQIASSLFYFDHTQNSFTPALAKEWAIDGNTYTITLKEDLKFHDGSPLTADDLIASVKRILIKRTSTHFPIWKYIVGCQSLSKMEQDCSGIEKINEVTVKFHLNQRTESLFLLLSSPEGTIWKKEDLSIDSFLPRAYSGHYFVSGNKNGELILSRNKFHPDFHEFPEAPEQINVSPIGGDELTQALKNKTIDITIELLKPLDSREYEKLGLKRHFSIPSTLLYFFRISDTKNASIGTDLIEQLWQAPLPSGLSIADTFLPFLSMGLINAADFRSTLPSQSTKSLRLAAVTPYYLDSFLDFITERAEKAGIRIEPIKRIDFDTLDKWIENPALAKDIDFVLLNYVASERFPAVQIRYILQHHKIPYDLNEMDAPEKSKANKQTLKSIETWFLKEQLVIPFYFVPTQIVHQSHIDIGDQPETDADIQLWRIR